MVSTRHVTAERNHSKELRRIRLASNAERSVTRRARKRKKHTEKRTTAIADGRRDVNSVTSPPGREAIEMSQ
jgi:hypothetical protein